MEEETLTLAQLAEETGIEPRTIRSYIERDLLPGAQSRGRGAAYYVDHLNRLQVIQVLRRIRPNISLAEIRIRLQQLTPEQIRAYAQGKITAAGTSQLFADRGDEVDKPNDETIVEVDSEQSRLQNIVSRPASPSELTGIDRLIHALRKLTRSIVPAPASKVESWQRITVTEDIELSVRGEFDTVQIGAFRELADILRLLLTRPDAFPTDEE
jgi:DNA-binding transcriptional MerR regulator